MIESVLFDMDGLLVDSEPWWKVAEKKVFGALGLNLDDELLRQVMGFRLNEVVEHWYRYQPWENPNFGKTERDILDCMEDLLLTRATLMPGAIESLEYCKLRNFKTCIASSSAMCLIQIVVKRFDLQQFFNHLHSAETEAFGKPHPAIFMKAADVLGSPPSSCIVIEDSVNGMVAAKAARMICAVVPEPEKRKDPRYGLADYRLNTLHEFPLLFS